MQRLFDGDAGVVEGDVETAIGAHRTINEGANLVLDQHVGLDVKSFAAGGLDRALDLPAEIAAAAAKSDLAALSAERQGRGAADPGGGAGDDDDPTLPANRRRPGWGGTGAALGGEARVTPAARPVRRPAAAPRAVEPRMRRRLAAGSALSGMRSFNLVDVWIKYIESRQ